MEILPALTTVSTLTTGMLAVVTDNIVPILGVLAFAWGVKFTLGRFNHATKGKV